MSMEVIPSGRQAFDEAAIRASGLDKVPPVQRQIALAYAERYSLELLLRHIAIIEGRPYVTRDALLHVAHRSGQFDGMSVSQPELRQLEGQGTFWVADAKVWRKDMSHPFEFSGRYPAKGGNQRFAPEMAIKVAEVMCLRRAFDISAPVFEERWDVDVMERGPEPTITETIAAKRAAITSGSEVLGNPAAVGQDVDQPADDDRRNTRPATPAGARTATPSHDSETAAEAGNPTPAPDTAERCRAFEPSHGRCTKDEGHRGPHAGGDGETWA